MNEKLGRSLLIEETDDLLVPLQEGLGSWVLKLASGDVTDEIEDIRKEVAAIRTPEQQIIVLTKIRDALDKAIRIRHGQSGFRRFVHDNMTRVANSLGAKGKRGNPLPEMDTRLRESIAALASLRDKVLAMKIKGSEEMIARVEKVKDQARSVADQAAKEGADDKEF